MTTQTEKEKEAMATLGREFFYIDNTAPVEGEELRYFQRRCLVEAKRIQGFLAKRLSKEVRDDIENMALFWCAMSQKQIIEKRDFRSLHCLLGRTLKQYQEWRVAPAFPYPNDL